MPPDLPALYRAMLLIRRFEERVYFLFMDGEIPGTLHQYQGQEAVAVGVCDALERTDWITSTHRPHGHALAKGVSARAAMAELYGKETGCCRGRGGSMHLGDPDVGMLPAIAIVAGGNTVVTGLGLAFKLRRSGQVAACFFGEGATNEGAFHEGLNFAAVQRLPVVFVCENNLYGASTAFTSVSLVDVAVALPPTACGESSTAWTCSPSTRRPSARSRLRAQATVRPSSSARRTATSATAAPTRAATGRTRRRRSGPSATRSRGCARRSPRETPPRARPTSAGLDDAVEFARASRPRPRGPGHMHTRRRLTIGEALREAIAEEMRRDGYVFLIGEDIGVPGGFGGAFGVYLGLVEEFGRDRILDTPISEKAIAGAAVGAALTGMRPIADMQYSDFLFECMDELVNQAAKLRLCPAGG